MTHLPQTRKSTPKYEVVTFNGTVVLADVSRTFANQVAREMNRDRLTVVTRKRRA